MSDVKVALINAGCSGMTADSERALAKELGGVGITGTNKSEEDLQKMIDAAMDQWGRVDVLVNSAGHGLVRPSWS